MKQLVYALVFILMPAISGAGGALEQKPSNHGVKETMDRLEELVKKKGMTVFARIDHKQNAVAIGKSLDESQLLIFGNPKLGTRIMWNDIRAGLDLPLRVLVYADPKGKTWVTYHNPQSMKNDFDLEGCISLDKAEKALDGLTGKAAE